MLQNSIRTQSNPAEQVIQVAVPRPLHAVYDYSVPADMPLPEPGCRVVVPFGNSTTVGVCVNNSVTQPHSKLKPIQEVVDASPLIPTEIMQLAQWMTTYYHYPLGEVLATVLPVAARRGKAAQLPEPDYWAAIETDPPETAPTGRKAPAQTKLHEYLRDKGPCSGADLVEAGHSRQVLKALCTKGLAYRLSEAEVQAAAQVARAPQPEPPIPTPEQANAINSITEQAGHFRPFLLQGVTGSGKTEVYMQAMQKVMQQVIETTLAQASDSQPQVLVLVPEIALTPQTLSRFAARFASVGMLHSNLSDSGRFHTWLRCANGSTQVLIGTRSAIFTPFKNLQLIIVDEEHDSSYKQQEGLRYSARDLATKRAMDESIPIVLGTATPSLESLHNANTGRYEKLVLTKRATGATMPGYHLIDMRGQEHTDGLSNPLIRVIRKHLSQEAQVLLYLNRRGFAPSLICKACGWQASCDACDAKLTLHSNPAHLRCHHCGHHAQMPRVCGECGRPDLLPVGLGTQRTEAGLEKLFPDVPVYRIDRDSVRSNADLEAQFAKINTGKPAIMVGTQMLAKGHHFPNVTLVAVVNADAGFLSPDFRAPERTAQLIEQVAGRAGREARPGQVWIQTYQPDNPTLKTLISEGYDAFAQLELKQRLQAGLPPSAPMAMLRADVPENGANPNDNPATAFLHQCKHALTQGSQLTCLGPIPAPLGRMNQRLRYQLMILAPDRANLHRALHPLINARPPRLVRWSIDVDPYDSL